MKVILFAVQVVLLVILVLAAGMGLFMLISFAVYQKCGPEWLTTNALLVFLLGGVLLAIGLAKLLEIVQYELLSIQAEEIEEEYKLKANPEAMALFEHLRVK